MRPYMPEQMYPYMYPPMVMAPRGGMPGYPQMPPMGPMGPGMPSMGPGMPPFAGPMPGPMPVPVPSQEPIPTEAGPLPTDKELLGERLYPMVEKEDAKNAAKVTGMLLEMEVEQIHNMIRDPGQLHRWIAEARKVLNTTPNQ